MTEVSALSAWETALGRRGMAGGAPAIPLNFRPTARSDSKRSWPQAWPETRREASAASSQGRSFLSSCAPDSPGPEVCPTIGERPPVPRRKSTHVDDPVAVGRRLREARERAGLSQRQLSFPGCSPAYVSRIEAGDRIPSLQLLREMGRRLGVSEDYLAARHGACRRLHRSHGRRARAASRRVRRGTADVRGGAREERRRRRASPSPRRARPSRVQSGQSARSGQPARRGEEGRSKRPLRSPGLGRHARARLLDARQPRRSGGHLPRVPRGRGATQRPGRKRALRRAPRERAHRPVRVHRSGKAPRTRGLELAPDSRDPVFQARIFWSHSRLHTLQNNTAAAASYARRASSCST